MSHDMKVVLNRQCGVWETPENIQYFPTDSLNTKIICQCLRNMYILLHSVDKTPKEKSVLFLPLKYFSNTVGTAERCSVTCFSEIPENLTDIYLPRTSKLSKNSLLLANSNWLAVEVHKNNNKTAHWK